MSKRKFKQTAVNFTKLLYVSSVEMKQENEPTHNHFIGCLDRLSRKFANNNAPNPEEDFGKFKGTV